MSFSLKQKIFAISWLVVSENAHESQRKFREKYGNPCPDHKTILRWKSKLENTGSLLGNTKGQGPLVTATGDENQEIVLDAIDRNMQTSTRRLSEETGISRTSVQRIIMKTNIRKWKPQLKHQLNDGDFDRRVEFSQFVIDKQNIDGSFISNLNFADEAKFYLSGHVSRHNCFYYAHENPNVVWQKPVNSPSILVWAMVSRRGVVSFHLQRESVNGDAYLRICNDKILPYFRDNRKIFVQDGAPSHYDHRVRQLLDTNLNGRWIGRRGSMCEFPPRSPDLTPCDFFLWGYLREIVYKDRNFGDISQLEEKIVDCLQNVPRDMFENSFKSFEERCIKCIQNNGHYIE